MAGVKKEYRITLPAIVTITSLLDFLVQVDLDFVPPISSKVDLVQYAQKLNSKATHCVAQESGGEKIIGLISFYCNDPQKINAYISVFGVFESARGKGLGSEMFDRVIDYVKGMGFAFMSFQTWESNRALSFYKSRGFTVYEKIQDRPNNECSLKMIKGLRDDG
jgi:ribosomal protein S18 acetylase RimI-like enzyme